MAKIDILIRTRALGVLRFKSTFPKEKKKQRTMHTRHQQTEASVSGILFVTS